MNKHERVGPFTIGGCAHNEMVERELRELWTAAGVTSERQDALIAEITAKAQPGAKVGPFTIGGCAHNEMESDQ